MKVCTLALLLQFRQGKIWQNIFIIKASQSVVAMMGEKCHVFHKCELIVEIFNQCLSTLGFLRLFKYIDVLVFWCRCCYTVLQLHTYVCMYETLGWKSGSNTGDATLRMLNKITQKNNRPSIRCGDFFYVYCWWQCNGTLAFCYQ
jgi:hypothetical protein